MSTHPTDQGPFLPGPLPAERFEAGQLVAVAPGVLLVAPAAVVLPVAPNAWVVLVGVLLTAGASFGVGHALLRLGVPQALALTVLSTAVTASVVMVLLLLTGRVGIQGWTGSWALAAVLGAVVVVVPAIHSVDLRRLESEQGFALVMLVPATLVVLILAFPVADVVADHRFRSDLADRVAGAGLVPRLPDIEGWEPRSVEVTRDQRSVDGLDVSQPSVSVSYHDESPPEGAATTSMQLTLLPEGDPCAALPSVGEDGGCRDVVGAADGAAVTDRDTTYLAVRLDGVLITTDVSQDQDLDPADVAAAMVAAAPITGWELVQEACPTVTATTSDGGPDHRFCER